MSDEHDADDFEAWAAASIQAGQLLPPGGKGKSKRGRKQARKRSDREAPTVAELKDRIAASEAAAARPAEPKTPLFETVLWYAGQPCTIEQVRGTLAILRYYDAFLASQHERCRNPEREWPRDSMTKDQARRRLGYIINMAINRKAGIPDEVGRKQSPDYRASLWRDCCRVRDRINRRVIVRRFETTEIRKRYGHLLETEDGPR